MISVSVYKTFDELKQLAADWNALLERSQANTVFLTWEWISQWIDTYQTGSRLLTLAVFDDNRLAAVAPLWIETRRIGGLPLRRILRFFGANEVCADHLDFIVHRKGSTHLIETLWEYLFGTLSTQWDTLEYHHAPDDSPVLRSFVQFAEADHRCLNHELEGVSYCPYILLPETWDEYVADLSANNRRALKVAHRRLADHGEPRLELCRKEQELKPAMERLIELNRRIWNERGESGSFSTPEFERFHLNIAREFLPREKLFLCSLWLDQQYLGAFYGFIHDRVLSFYIMSAERQLLPRVNIGRVLLGMCVEKAIELSCREFDMLRGDEEYKTHWTDRTRCNVLFTLHRRSVRSMIALALRYLRQMFKVVIKTLFGARWGTVRKALTGR